MTEQTTHSIDVDEASFDKAVLEESHQRPVVVDFWAPWCGPCRFLGPTLEKLAEEGEGRWLLVKLNTDENPNVSMKYKIQGIPAVKAFRNGKVFDEFVGALPEPQVRAWLDGFVPGPAEDAIKEALAHIKQKDLPAARLGFERALELKPYHPHALLGLANISKAEGKTEEALDHLARILEADVKSDALAREIAALKLKLQGGGDHDLPALQQRIEDDENDLEARFELGRALAAQQEHAQALESLLQVIQRSKSPTDKLPNKARETMLEIFDSLGNQHELTSDYRSKLAQSLYR